MENERSVVLLDEMIKYHIDGLQFVMAEAHCKYIRPIKLTDKLVCEMSFVPVRPTSFDIRYRFKNEETGRPLVIPDWFTKKYLE